MTNRSPDSFKTELKTFAHGLGFQLFGVASSEPFDSDTERLRAWLDRGDGASMASYLGRDTARRRDPNAILPGVRSIIMIGMSYVPETKTYGPIESSEGHIARYARGRDYHGVLGERLDAIVEWMRTRDPSIQPESISTEEGTPVLRRSSSEPEELLNVESTPESIRFVDTGPVFERAAARRAGLGFIGRNNCLIHPQMGSWFVLGGILTRLEIPPDKPLEIESTAIDGHPCGDCHRCMEACPTGALCEPNRLDARRCIAYWTIESRESIPSDIARSIGDRLFGCDRCQEACPFNNRPQTALKVPHSSSEPVSPFFRDSSLVEASEEWSLERILSIETNRQFEVLTKETAMARPRRAGLIRNALIVAVNRKRVDLIDPIAHLASSRPEPGGSALIRETAIWALELLTNS